MVHIYRKVFLVGFAIAIQPGSLMQLLWALNVSISVIAIEVQVQPFRRLVDSYCSLISALATIFTLLICMVLKAGSLVEDLRQSNVPPALWALLDFDPMIALGVLFSASIGVICAVLGFMLFNLSRARQYPRIKHAHSGEAQLRKLHTISGYRTRHHVFVSHV